MRVFFTFLIKHHFTLLFLVLQIISFVFIVSYNHSQRTAYLNSSSYTSGILNSGITNIGAYFSLAEENKKLITENTNLRNQFRKNYKKIKVSSNLVNDTVFLQNFKLMPAEVIQSTVYKSQNFITLNIGRIQGVKEGSGVVSADGIIGVVKSISNNYSVVLPLINKDFKVSCRLGYSQYYGSLLWDGMQYNEAKLHDIPLHVSVHKGDSLFTTGFSSIYPTGELVGFVKEAKVKSGENFFDITVRLSVDFKKIRYVYVVDHLLKQELDSLKIITDG